MDTYSDLFDELDSIDWEKETAPTAFNYEDGEPSYSPDLPNFDEMASIPSPISPFHSPPPAAMDETKPAMPSQKQPPPAMDYEPTSPPALKDDKPPAKDDDYRPPALKDEKPPASCKNEKPSEPPRKFKRPSSSLRPKDQRITLKRKPSQVRAPSTPRKVHFFVKIPKRDVPP
ncbi:hypothetical protein AVEN_188772-1, partial [Araneus ventricosus]